MMASLLRAGDRVIGSDVNRAVDKGGFVGRRRNCLLTVFVEARESQLDGGGTGLFAKVTFLLLNIHYGSRVRFCVSCVMLCVFAGAHAEFSHRPVFEKNDPWR